jgi:putative DNA primase/helicase
MNGIYDLVTNTLLPFSKDIIITNKLPWNYNPTAYSELVDKSLNEWSCKDEKIRAVLEECVGACMYRSALLAGGKAFILTGDKANGKSTFFTIVNCLLGNENIASLDLKELGDRFSTAMIFGKLANIGDDISDDFIPDTSFFKKVVTGNRIKAERKGIDPFEFNPYCKLLFSANDIPRMKDKTGAVMRRLMIIPFNAVFEKPDPFISEKLCEREAMEYLALLGIKGLLRVKQSNSFTTSQKIIEKIEEYDIENNPVLGFIKETDDEFIIHQPTADVYRRYQLFCQENGYQPIGNGNFSKMINKKKHLKVVQRKIGGKNTKIFERDDD